MKIVKDETIVKSNKLMEAKIKFSANEYKLITYLLGKIEKNDREFRTFDIEIKELNKFCFGINGTATYSYIKNKYSRALSKKDIIIKGEHGVSIYNWFTLIDTNKQGIFSICFSPELKDFLLQDDAHFENGGYTKYKLSNILDLKSFSSIRLYEILKQYEKIGKRELSIEDLKYMLGIEKHQYKKYKDFKKWVLKKAIEEINEKTDIKVTFEESKLGRSTNELKFYIVSERTIHKSKELVEIKEKIESIVNREVNTEVLEKAIKKHTISKKTIELYLENWDKFAYKDMVNPVGVFLHACATKIPIPTMQKGMYNNKPEQATNFEQRQYSDEWFESLYDNF